MKLSVITINYNNVNGLKKTIDSIVNQTWRDFEWIIIDGGSTDGSKELIEEVASDEKNNVSYWCSEPDNGIYNAMNKGIVKAKGEWLNFMNSGDCFYENTTLEKVFNNHHFEDIKTYDVMYGDTSYENGNNIEYRKAQRELSLSHFLNYTICHQSSFIRRTTIKNGFDERYRIVADRKAWIEAVLSNKNFKYLDLPVSRYDITGISSNAEQLIGDKEKMISESVSPLLLKDYAELFERRERDEWYPELQQTFYFISKRRLYKRIVKCSLKLISYIDRIL